MVVEAAPAILTSGTLLVAASPALPAALSRLRRLNVLTPIFVVVNLPGSLTTCLQQNTG
jgi:hypothetical protein